ncbi:MAG: hypothetical protein PSV35_04565, partial [bacterium]|nr:hypothetical protein [bacterium]
MHSSISYSDLSPSTVISSVKWPPIMDLDSTRLLLMLDYLEQSSQWLSEEQLWSHQLNQLNSLVGYVKNHTEFYRKAWNSILPLLTSQTLKKNWHQLPLVTTQQLIEYNQQFFSEISPPAHGPVRQFTHLIKSKNSRINSLKNNAVELMDGLLPFREYVWQKRLFRETVARVIISDNNSLIISKDWGKPFTGVVQTGPLHLIKGINPEELASMIVKSEPYYLLSTVDTWSKLLDYYRENPPLNWSIQEIILEDGLMTQEMQHTTQLILNTAISDRYNHPVCGIIALRCPEYNNLHVQAEQLLVEVMDNEGNP